MFKNYDRFLEAIKKNNIKLLDQLINENDFKVNDQDNLGQTLLHHAVQIGSYQVVLKLLQAGAALHIKDNNNECPLDIVMRHSTKKRGYNAFADSTKRIQSIKEIVTLLQATQRERDHLLFRAVNNNDKKYVIDLLNMGANPKAQDNKPLVTPLHDAVKNKNREICEILLKAGADPNAKTNKGDTPLHFSACYKGQDKITQLLINYGADINIKNEKNLLPSHGAIRYKNNTALPLLLDQNKKLDNTLLHTAAKYNNIAALEQLMLFNNEFEKKNNVKTDLINSKDGFGFTPLHWAVRNRHYEMAWYLLSHGAKSDITNDLNELREIKGQTGYTVYEMAERQKNGYQLINLFDRYKKIDEVENKKRRHAVLNDTDHNKNEISHKSSSKEGKDRFIFVFGNPQQEDKTLEQKIDKS